jgi:hypothetical protein
MNVAVTTAAEGFPRRAFTVEDVRRMIEVGVIHEDERFELVDGEIVMMAAKVIAHERVKSALNIAVVRALPDHLTIGVAATLRLTPRLRFPDFRFVSARSIERSCQRSRIESCMCSRSGASRKSMMRRLPVRISAFTDMPGSSAAGRPSTSSVVACTATCTV